MEILANKARLSVCLKVYVCSASVQRAFFPKKACKVSLSLSLSLSASCLSLEPGSTLNNYGITHNTTANKAYFVTLSAR